MYRTYSIFVDLIQPVVYLTVVKFIYVLLTLLFIIILLVVLTAANFIVNVIEMTFAQNPKVN